MNTTVRYHLLHPFTFKNRNSTRALILQLFQREKKVLESLDFIFCSDEYLLDLNKSFLEHDYYTDVITFDLSETSSGSRRIKGEVYISIERVKENAVLHHTPSAEELKRVMIHGALHLCGYKDKTKKDQLLMKEKENFYLSLQ